MQVADPNSSGTSYTMLATIVQLMGEDKALRLPEAPAQEHQPVHQVGRGARQGGGAAARPPIGITFLHDLVTMSSQGAPVKVVAPCEGTGYEIGSMSIIKGAQEPRTARRSGTTGR